MNACIRNAPCSAAVMAIVAALAGSTRAQGLCAPGFSDAGNNVCAATFILTGAPESIALPPGMAVIRAVVSGAAGGTSLEEQVDPFGGAASPAGNGGRATAVVPVVPGAMLTVVVGQAGTGGMLAPPGYGGYGGGGHATSRYGGNGGGGSYVFDTTDPNNTLVLVAAGGGGGGGYDYNPVVLGRGDQQNHGGNGSGASPAGDGTAVPFCCDGTAQYGYNAGGGGGATPGSPGVGGHPTLPAGYVFGQADGDYGFGPAIDQFNFGIGGSTHNGCCYYTGWAGGGGGGYYGGGGGGNIEAQLEGGGGGGGAGYVTPDALSSTSETGVQPNDGEVTISYYVGACDPSCLTCSGPTATDCATCGPGLVVVNGACVTGPTSTTSTSTVAPTTSTGGASTSTTSTVATPSTTSSTLAPVCAATPIASSDCRLAAPRASSVQIKNNADKHKDLLKWKWAKGAATTVAEFGDPVAGSATYHLCVYDSSRTAQPLMDVPVAPGGTCGTVPCWKAAGTTGFEYKSKDGKPLGITIVKLKAGDAGKANVQMKGKGALLPTTPLPLTTPVAVQLVIRDGTTTQCWQTIYPTSPHNDAKQFGAKGP